MYFLSEINFAGVKFELAWLIFFRINLISINWIWFQRIIAKKGFSFSFHFNFGHYPLDGAKIYLQMVIASYRVKLLIVIKNRNQTVFAVLTKYQNPFYSIKFKCDNSHTYIYLWSSPPKFLARYFMTSIFCRIWAVKNFNDFNYELVNIIRKHALTFF